MTDTCTIQDHSHIHSLSEAAMMDSPTGCRRNNVALKERREKRKKERKEKKQSTHHFVLLQPSQPTMKNEKKDRDSLSNDDI